MNRSNRTLASLDYTARGTGVAPWQIEGGRKRKKKKKTRGGKTGRELWWRHNSVSEPSERVSYVFQKHSAPSPYVHNTLKLPSLLSFSPFLPNVSRCFLFAGSRISSSCLSLAPSRRCPLSPRTYGRAFTPRRSSLYTAWFSLLREVTILLTCENEKASKNICIKDLECPLLPSMKF